MNKKLVVVVGATGQQGGSVVRSLLQNENYTVRGLTRNLESESSRALIREGTSMVYADINNLDDLIQAFKSAYAIFGVTDFGAQIREHGPKAAAEAETQQGINIAQAAAATPSLEHLVWSTIPSAWAISSGRMTVPHFESKAKVDDYIIRSHEELAKKTTFLWVGYYASNVLAPAMKPTCHATSGKDVWLSPVAARTELLSIGCPGANVGVFVHAILDLPHLTLPAKYVMAQVECTTLGAMMESYGSITGRPTQLICIGPAAFRELFPEWDAVAKMLEFWEVFGSRSFAKYGVEPLTAADLSLDIGSLVSTKQALKMIL
ncbi:hypothetical protein LTR56_010609 [Elasticomyces elasticus]|nr:hypothetical protein LTR56_010609 [Elasticomyces elasticus]KAK3648652.1 hypothetical protein LTR22_013288 [Elasticomyces elasticus]KAK4932465.1 hypothetical protein LTR49_001334 [Elasticomyces elasticus]KAK5760166.1 hypothetical protein LTS12_009721 [Elasticomyces elasticus]